MKSQRNELNEIIKGKNNFELILKKDEKPKKIEVPAKNVGGNEVASPTENAIDQTPKIQKFVLNFIEDYKKETEQVKEPAQIKEPGQIKESAQTINPAYKPSGARFYTAAEYDKQRPKRIVTTQENGDLYTFRIGRFKF